MTPTKPSPEDFLAMAQNSPNGLRGALRIYLGMCPGVGKTYAMLEDARRLINEGSSLAVGIVETHGRSDTKAMLAGLPMLAGRSFSHRGTEISEFDLDEALRLKPTVVLVDELAHSNAPGSRHPKRWQDVEELLSAGIDVWTTVNIQHVESLRDAVMGITGIRVQETVPDSFLESADEVRVIDLTPEQLLDRLSKGKVYLGDRATLAANRFFREGNLRALREMVLRFTARKVDAEKREFMRRNLIAGPWRSGERFLVAVGPSPHAKRLIRITCRLAQAHDAGWIAAHIDTGEGLDEDSANQLAENLSFARSLGGETISFAHEDPVRGLLHVAKRENVTQLVAGKAPSTNFFTRWLQQSIPDRLQHESGDIDILLVHPGGDSAKPRATKATPSRASSALRDVTIAGSTLVGVTIFSLLIEPIAGYRPISLLYLLSVAIAGIFISRWSVIALAIFGCITWNFCFTEPRFTFEMMHAEDAMLLATSLVVAIVIGHLTTRLRERETVSRTGEERAQALYRLTRVTSASPSLAHGVSAGLKQLDEVFNCRSTFLVNGDESELVVFDGDALSQKELAVCRWVFEHDQPAGRFTTTLPESPILAIPLSVNGKKQAVLALHPADSQLASPITKDLLQTFLAHFSVMLEKEEYLNAQRDALLSERSRHFQRALLDHVSHEIKTPVAVILASSDHLLKGSHEPGLLTEIHEAALRLNRVFNQLVTLSRAEAGLITPAEELCDAHDLIDDVVRRFPAVPINVTGDSFTILTDASLCDTILFNLIQNAVQHGKQPITITTASNSAGAHFDVCNAGPDIPDAHRERIFDRYERGSESGGGGMGLGLPIAREFAALLGGDVRLVQSSAKRTVFRLSFPKINSETLAP